VCGDVQAIVTDCVLNLVVVCPEREEIPWLCGCSCEGAVYEVQPNIVNVCSGPPLWPWQSQEDLTNYQEQQPWCLRKAHHHDFHDVTRMGQGAIASIDQRMQVVKALINDA
jgi:hypothetical protein